DLAVAFKDAVHGTHPDGQGDDGRSVVLQLDQDAGEDEPEADVNEDEFPAAGFVQGVDHDAFCECTVDHAEQEEEDAATGHFHHVPVAVDDGGGGAGRVARHEGEEHPAQVEKTHRVNEAGDEGECPCQHPFTGTRIHHSDLRV